MESTDAADANARCPRLVAGSDVDACVQSPAEGFLLSRIDGLTPIATLREIGGLAPEEVDACIERWEKDGLIDFGKAPRIRRRLKPGEIDEGDLDPSLSIDVELQRRILVYESNLGKPDHELLGVDADADVKKVKRAYFKLSKEFHPDRYFRKNIGDYGPRLEAIFKRILEAYELLSDPELKAEVQRSRTIAAASESPSGAQSQTTPQAPAGPPRKLTKLERLKARMPIRLPSSVLAERQARAQQLFDESKRAAHRGKYAEAAAHRRLAIAFDPFEPKFREGFADLRAKAAGDRAEAAMRAVHQADSKPAEEMANKEALRAFEDALVYRPFDPHFNRSAARCAAALGDGDRAMEYAQTAVEQDPDRSESHTVLAIVHLMRSERGHAMKELEKAVELNPSDEEAADMRRKIVGTSRGAGPDGPGGKQ